MIDLGPLGEQLGPVLFALILIGAGISLVFSIINIFLVNYLLKSRFSGLSTPIRLLLSVAAGILTFPVVYRLIPVIYKLF
jgi:hypothetical protein